MLGLAEDGRFGRQAVVIDTTQPLIYDASSTPKATQLYTDFLWDKVAPSVVVMAAVAAAAAIYAYQRRGRLR